MGLVCGCGDVVLLLCLLRWCVVVMWCGALPGCRVVVLVLRCCVALVLLVCSGCVADVFLPWRCRVGDVF